jgi:site-specific DNA-methyltransferase (adenine-specific)
MIRLTNEDCMETMSRFPDNYFDIAIVDPPYGILNKTKRGGDYKFNMAEYSQWDVKPGPEYFKELKRVSKHQIVWGGNYFGQIWAESEYNKCFLIWDKNQPETLNNFSMAEMAWTSLDKPSKIFHYSVRKNRGKIHPTQKPIDLYAWILRLFGTPGMKILDTHLGSGTIAVACHNANVDLWACEISRDYLDKATELIREHVPAKFVKEYEKGKLKPAKEKN